MVLTTSLMISTLLYDFLTCLTPLQGIQRLHLFAPGSKICALYPSHSLLQLSTLRVVILPLATEDDFSTSNPRLLGLLVVTELTFIPMYKGLIT
ncbi:hypothetical protein Lalb_Chr18g0053481 [Lupinus albus]|uniref:Uncharacterized protein n=1 Tax=Lupinus albus TaxID=3870 RepID=A0A6A4P452_LUPAL|nr:hypothetical protein Lalb_Chr18g0053481 [Lupinus albus]